MRTSVDEQFRLQARRRLRQTGIASGLVLLSAGAVNAQPASDQSASVPGSGGLQEIVVTAQRRSENIQNVPIAVTAFTSETLKSKGITDIHALSNLTPNVNLDAGAPFSGDSSVLSASIRGIGQDDFAFNLDPGVGVYLDGVYLARTIGANQNLLDVDRIEILKGPQGTLFGANTIGGAISIVTHTPGPEQHFEATATTGRYNRRDFAFTADMPITSNLLSTITVSSQVRDGYQKVIPYPAGAPEATIPYVVDPQTAYPKAGTDGSDSNGGQNLQVIRGKLLFLASDKVKVTFSGDWAHQNQSAIPDTDQLAIPNATFSGIYNMCISTSAARLNSLDMQNSADQAYISSFDPSFVPVFQANQTTRIFNTTNGLCAPRASGAAIPSGTGLPYPGGAALGGAGYIGGPPGPFNAATAGAGYQGSANPRIFWNSAATNTGNIDTTYSTGPSFAKYDAFGGSGTVDVDLTDALHFKSITGYRQIKWDVGIDLDGTPESIQEVTDQQHQYQWSEELQLSGKALDNKLDFVGGLYFFHEAGYVHDFVPFEGILFIYDAANDVDTKNYAAFVHADYKITDQFGLTLGGRYTDDRKKFVGGQEDLNGFAYKFLGCPSNVVLNPVPFGPPGGIPNPAGLPCSVFVGFPDASQPLRYFPPAPLSQTYHIFTPTAGVQYHVNSDMMLYANYSKGFKAGGWSTRLSQAVLDGNLLAFKPEYSKTTELGLKSEWLEHHLLANAAIFYTDYTNIQLNVQTGASPVYLNAGNAKMKGGELEMQAILGHGLSLNFAGAYIDAYYTYVNPAIGIPQSYDLATGTVFGAPLSAQLPKTPKYKLSLGPTYDIGLANSATLRLAADFTYTARMFNDSLNTPELIRPPTHNLDASIHYLSPAGTYEFVVGGTNLTDDRYITVGSVNYAAGEIASTYNPPREWYLSIKAKVGQ